MKCVMSTSEALECNLGGGNPTAKDLARGGADGAERGAADREEATVKRAASS